MPVTFHRKRLVQNCGISTNRTYGTRIRNSKLLPTKCSDGTFSTRFFALWKANKSFLNGCLEYLF